MGHQNLNYATETNLHFPKKEAEKLVHSLKEKNINNISITGRLDRKSTIKKIQESSIGILINSDESIHSTDFTSPLKYFEYIFML